MTWSRLFPRRGLPILCYHRVGGDAHNAVDAVDLSTFRQQMQWLRQLGFQTMVLEELVSLLASGLPLPRQRVVLTFDDGYESFYHEASVTLREFGYAASVFVPTDYAFRSASWDEWVSVSGEKILSWGQMEELAGDGFSFYPHGLTHRCLTGLSAPQLERELSVSRQVLEDHLSRPARIFCYPYGERDSRVEEATRAAGYQGACSLRPDLNWSAEQLWDLGRMQVLSTTTLRGFRARLTGAFTYYAAMRRLLRGGSDRRREDGG
jgi:peptidoglycan/xylan/chitin deacetylase (PgdA/CDA1 family)